MAAYAVFALLQQYNAERLADWSCADGISGESVSFCRTMPAAREFRAK